MQECLTSNIELANERRFVATGPATKMLGCSDQSLRAWARLGLIEFYTTPGGKFRFDVDGFIERRRAALAARRTRAAQASP